MVCISLVFLCLLLLFLSFADIGIPLSLFSWSVFVVPVGVRVLVLNVCVQDRYGVRGRRATGVLQRQGLQPGHGPRTRLGRVPLRQVRGLLVEPPRCSWVSERVRSTICFSLCVFPPGVICPHLSLIHI